MANKTVFVTGFGNIEDHAGTQTVMFHPFQVRNALLSSLLPNVRRQENPLANNTNVLIIEASNYQQRRNFFI